MWQTKCSRNWGDCAESRVRWARLPRVGNLAGCEHPFTPHLPPSRLMFVRFRRLILFVLTVLVATAPLLACLPTPAMTDAEMACCKKMAGNCDMGAGNHSCCRTRMNGPQLAAATEGDSQRNQSAHLVAVPFLLADVKVNFVREGVRAVSSAVSNSPPGSQSILRI